MKKLYTYEELVRRGKWLTRWFKFYYALSRITRFSLHGFVLWRLRAVNRKGEIHNRQVATASREHRRLAAIQRRGGRR